MSQKRGIVHGKEHQRLFSSASYPTEDILPLISAVPAYMPPWMGGSLPEVP